MHTTFLSSRWARAITATLRRSSRSRAPRWVFSRTSAMRTSRSWARASVLRRRSGLFLREVRGRSSIAATPFRGGVRPTLPKSPRWFAAWDSPFDSGSHLEPLTAVCGDRRLVQRSGGRTAEFEIDVRVPGLHNRANLAAAIAGAIELEVHLERMLPEVPKLRLPQGRYDRIAAAGRPPHLRCV